MLKTQRVFFGFAQTKPCSKLKTILFLCGAYIPPRNNSTNLNIKTDYFSRLEKSILKRKWKGYILIMGTLILGQVTKGTYITADLINHILHNNDGVSKLTKRCYNNLKTNISVNILKLCNNHNLRIVNGQTPGDLIQNFTYFKK